MNFEYDLIAAMREWDLHINSINLEVGKYHRFRSLGTCKTKCCEYRVFENQLGAHFKCFRRGIDRFWFAKDRSVLTTYEKEQMQAERDHVTRERIAAQSRMSSKCAKFMTVAGRSTETPSQHPYVRRKGIYPHGAHLVRDMLVLPILDIEGSVMSLQFIKPNGFKQFKTGAPTAEGMIWLGGYKTPDYRGIVRLCEGWSTGCTIYSITKSPVICALNAYNLIKVASALRTYYPETPIKICADNDQWGKENVGLKCANQASLMTGYALHYPTFDNVGTFNKPTDFNDLYLLGGVETTKNQLILIRETVR